MIEDDSAYNPDFTQENPSESFEEPPDEILDDRENIDSMTFTIEELPIICKDNIIIEACSENQEKHPYEVAPTQLEPHLPSTSSIATRDKKSYETFLSKGIGME